MKYYSVALLALIICSCAACSPLPDQDPSKPSGDSDSPEHAPLPVLENPFAPQAGDSEMEIQNAYLDDIAWDAKTHKVVLSGNLPTPCNQLRVFAAAESGTLLITTYSVYPPDEGCVQMLEPFEAALEIPDGISHFIVNGELIGM